MWTKLALIRLYYSRLNRKERINFLAKLWKEEPFLMKYSRMGPAERRFHNPKAKRSNK